MTEDRSALIEGSADSSAIITGERNTATITITNYYYHDNTPVIPTESTDIESDNLKCPYRGLFHFRPDDAEFFYGRQLFIEELFEITKIRNFIPVLGASGSGKSSVVLAGLVPKLQKEGNWLFTHFRPGADPFYALALALIPLYTTNLNATEQIAQARQLAGYLHDKILPLDDIFAKIQQNHPNYRVLLIADQFEELYTLCDDEKTRRSFLDTLLAATQSFFSKSNLSHVLVATMRADFLGNILSYRPLADVVRADIKLPTMNRSELTQVIEKPALKLGVTFQDGLVERILDDIDSEPGNLPLLEFALTQLWKYRTGKLLTHTAYEEIGEVSGALTRYADDNYAKLSITQQEIVRRIFIQLVRPGEGTEDTRRLATKTELDEENWELVKYLADIRLVVTSQNAAHQETVEVVHEALIKNWDKLIQWMKSDRNFRAWQERLRGVMYQWEQTQRDEGALLRGTALVEAEERLTKRREDLGEREQEFIQASCEVRNREQQKRERKRQITIAKLVGSLVLALGLSAFAGWQWRQASKQAIIARLGENAATVKNELPSQPLNAPKYAKYAKKTKGVTMTNNNLYALLIGIDCYLPNRLPDGSYYKNLGGCVRDINHVEAYFVNNLNVPKTNILKLTASNVEGSDQPKESLEQLPTYKNMVAKFKEVTDTAQKGDVVYIHYSGHGGRAKTHFPKLKGNLGVDETLVPTDIGTSEAQYLRDVELAYIFKRMADKGLVLTVVLDSCHSGGAARGVDSDVRGLSVIDTTPRNEESLVASSEELIAAWDSNKNTTGDNTTRNVTASGWIPEPSGYTLLAACRDNEFAQEYPFDGKERNGALTYWLLDSLKKLGTQVSYKTLHDRLLAKIHSQFEQQTPMLQGDSNRLIFGIQTVSHQYCVPVLKVDLAKNKVLLQVGEAYGIRNGAEFAVYSLGTVDFNQTDKRVALVKITEIGAVDSWAEIKQMLSTNKKEDIELGANALLLHESVKLVRKVALLPNKAALAELERIKPILEGNQLIEFVSGSEINSGDKDIAYQVYINEKQEYEILKAGKPITNLQPILKAGQNSAITLIKRLIHLCKYQAILQLDNNDPISSLAGKIKIELCKAGENRQLVSFDEPGNVPTLNDNSTAYIKIRNFSSQTLNITVLVAQPDWSVTKLHPKGADFEILEAGKEIPVRFSANLPDGNTQSTYVFKVFATVGATNFDWLKLPALDKAVEHARSRPKNPLEDLFATIGSENPPRNISAAAYASDEWTTEQVELTVIRTIFDSGATQ